MQNFVAAGRDGHPNWRVLKLSALPFQVAGGAARVLLDEVRLIQRDLASIDPFRPLPSRLH